MYLSENDLTTIGIRFEKIQDYAQTGILKHHITYKRWRKKQARILLDELRKLKENLGTSPFNSWALDTIFHKLMLQNWENKLLQLT